MKISSRNTISVVSILFIIFISSCSSPEDYAKRWCDLNRKIDAANGVEKEKLKEQAANLEEEVFRKYANDKVSLNKVIDLTNACN